MKTSELDDLRQQAELDQRLAAFEATMKAFTNWFADEVEHVFAHNDPGCQRCLKFVTGIWGALLKARAA